ncbi:hypothetical protein MCOR25_005679 [Pyricularia grisea]|uniref:Carboxylic ester hydrolase n=1 Tax=Pyricularia grisea TaxID=148305 RepID=A0A6P8B987_PYRGI|nr:uncharacterized protein PgNI_03071 [Pyricularia grisea]KAI6364339.1 hypothetical protein MCOR25_005679 [Pyricularia grisea]TLD12212.1 hypothetical protein PgNI_03071 [Pyricularia grisea]
MDRIPTIMMTAAMSMLWTATVTAAPKSPTIQELKVALDYGSFQGAYSPDYNISYWQKIPFAAPPVGDLRFRGPQPPKSYKCGGIYNSSEAFDMCPQRTTNGSEDCLYLGLYTRPWTPAQPLRPVIIAFYGGGFIRGSATFTPPPSLYPIHNLTGGDTVVIYPNYRTNAFGFLPGRQVADDWPESDLNPGLLDQRAAIEWARSHVRHFGGDPDGITIQGQSAGGGSVLAQVLAVAGQEEDSDAPRPFRAALANSPFWPKVYRYDSPEAQWIFDKVAEEVGCGRAPSAAGEVDTRLACLKTADVQAIRQAALLVADSHVYTTSTFTWAPVMDGRFLRRPLSSLAASGKSGISAGFAMYNTHEGEDFVPPAGNLSFDSWLPGFLPNLSPGDLAAVESAYPEVGSSEAITEYSNSSVRAGLIYRDVVLACPALWFANSSRQGWLGEYSISPAKHASDVYWWNTINPVQQTDRFHFEGYTGALASFLQNRDPNARKLTNSSIPGVPPLTSGKEFHIDSQGFGELELEYLRERCALWQSLAPKVPL